MCKKMALVAVGLLFGVTNVSAKVFKWVDAQGVTHYSEGAPSRQKATEIQAPPEPAAVGNQGVNPENERWQKIEAEYQKHKAERQAAEKVRALEEENAELLAVETRKKCTQVQNNLFVLQQKTPVFTLNEKGNRVYLEDTARSAEIASAKQFIEANCR